MKCTYDGEWDAMFAARFDLPEEPPRPTGVADICYPCGGVLTLDDPHAVGGEAQGDGPGAFEARLKRSRALDRAAEIGLEPMCLVDLPTDEIEAHIREAEGGVSELG